MKLGVWVSHLTASDDFARLSLNYASGVMHALATIYTSLFKVQPQARQDNAVDIELKTWAIPEDAALSCAGGELKELVML